MFPPLADFAVLARQPTISLDLGHRYQKRSLLNRYYIQTAQGPLGLTVPVEGPQWNVAYGDIRLHYGDDWPRKHLRALETAYRPAPYYEEYSPRLAKLLNHRYDFLHQLSEAALSFCLERAGVSKKVEIITAEAHPPSQSIRFTPIITPNTATETGAEAMLAYRSVFGAVFDHRVSVLDALFCAGPRRLQAWVQAAAEAATGGETLASD